MTKSEMNQKMMLCISTLYKLNGRVPDAAELYRALGSEYAEVLADYVCESNKTAIL